MNEQVVSDESFPQWRYQIWDFSNVEKFEASQDDLRRFALEDSVVARKNPNHRVAVVLRKGAGSGRDRIYHIFQEAWEGFESESFLDIDTARRWAEGGHNRRSNAT